MVDVFYIKILDIFQDLETLVRKTQAIRNRAVFSKVQDQKVNHRGVVDISSGLSLLFKILCHDAVKYLQLAVTQNIQRLRVLDVTAQVRYFVGQLNHTCLLYTSRCV